MKKKIKTQPVKRKYTKRKKHPIAVKHDELSIMQDMFGSFESLSEDARTRAAAYFVHKYHKYFTS